MHCTLVGKVVDINCCVAGSVTVTVGLTGSACNDWGTHQAGLHCVHLETLQGHRIALPLAVSHLTYASGICSLLPSRSAVKTSLIWANESLPSSALQQCKLRLRISHLMRGHGLQHQFPPSRQLSWWQSPAGPVLLHLLCHACPTPAWLCQDNVSAARVQSFCLPHTSKAVPRRCQCRKAIEVHSERPLPCQHKAALTDGSAVQSLPACSPDSNEVKSCTP